MLYNNLCLLELYNKMTVKISNVGEHKFDEVLEALLLNCCLYGSVTEIVPFFQSLKARGLFMNTRYVLPWMREKSVRKMSVWQQQILQTN